MAALSVPGPPEDGAGAARWHRHVARVVTAVAGARLITSFATGAPLVALTVDDGPHPTTTPDLLEVLASHGAAATFFSTGEHAARYPDLVRRIAAVGHELGNHLQRDEPSVLLTAAEFERQLGAVHALLASHGPVRWFRPGSGWFTPRMLRTGARQGYGCALGSPGLAAARYPAPERLGERLAARCRRGDVVVLHEGGAERAAVTRVARALLTGLAAKGLRAVTLSQVEESTGGNSPARGGRDEQ